jgi:hypothetical protein
VPSADYSIASGTRRDSIRCVKICKKTRFGFLSTRNEHPPTRAGSGMGFRGSPGRSWKVERWAVSLAPCDPSYAPIE